MAEVKKYDEYVVGLNESNAEYKAPYYSDGGKKKEITNGEQLAELLNREDFRYAYGKQGGFIAYVSREILNKKSYTFRLSEDGVTVEVVKTNRDKTETIIDTFVLDENLNPQISRIAKRGLQGVAKNGKTSFTSATDFDLVRVTRLQFQFLDKSKIYPALIEKSKAYVTEYANVDGNIDLYISQFPDEWENHLKKYFKKNEGLSDSERERITTNPTTDEFIDVIVAKSPYSKGGEVKTTMYYRKKDDGGYTVKYYSTGCYILYNVYGEDGTTVISQAYTEIEKDLYYKLSSYYGGSTGAPKKEKEIAAELDRKLNEIGREYEIRDYIVNHILTMSFSYRLQGKPGVRSMVFVNEQLLFTGGGYFEDDTFNALINDIVEPHRVRYRANVKADAYADREINAEDGDANIEF